MKPQLSLPSPQTTRTVAHKRILNLDNDACSGRIANKRNMSNILGLFDSYIKKPELSQLFPLNHALQKCSFKTFYLGGIDTDNLI